MSNLMTTSEVGDYLVIPERTLTQWRYLGRGPAYLKVGQQVRYREADVDAWLAEHTVATGGAG